MAVVNGKGIQNFFLTLLDQVITSSAAVVSILLGGATGINIAAGQTLKVRYWVKFSVGATGGVRSIIAVPAGGTLLSVTTILYNTVAPSITTSSAATVFTNALANAGTHWLLIEAIVVNGTTAGTVDLQMAQNTSDALSLTILRGGTAEVTKI